MRTLSYPKISQQISGWIREEVTEAGATGVVVGLSGGIDSSVAATLAVKGLGNQKVLGLTMPEIFTPELDSNDAWLLADNLKIGKMNIPIHPIVEIYGPDENQKIASANLRARIRMTLLYYHANSRNKLVLGTGDLSEHLLGYFTKYGDGGTDLEPIGNLYKTEVRQLGKYLGVPEQICRKPSSPQLYPGHLASQELPATYEEIDPLLYSMFHGTDYDSPLAKKVMAMWSNTRHKRRPPLSPDIYE